MGRRSAKAGDTLGFEAPSGMRGRAQVIRTDDFGTLVKIEDSAGRRHEAIVYVNPASIRHWTVHPGSTNGMPAPVPTFFFGNANTQWTIQSPDRVEVIRGGGVSAKELEERGYVHKVLWHARRIEEWLDGKPLVWPFEL